MKKSVVLLTTKYSDGKNDAWLTNEISYSFVNSGFDMTVIVLSWLKDDPESSVKLKDGVNVIRIKLHRLFYETGFIGTALKVFLFPIWARFYIKKHVKKCDLLVCSTPCITILRLPAFFKRRYGSKNYLVLWDFFPFYLKDLGLMRNWVVFKFFKYLETKMFQSFDRIGCMTQGNINFLINNYSKIEVSRIEKLPLWTQRCEAIDINKQEVRRRFGLPSDKVIAVYGGAMSVVQELENVLDLAMSTADEEIFFVFIGRGTEKERLKDYARDHNMLNVKFLDYVPRQDYEELIGACDIGIISLSRKLSVPSFPSKSIDYFKVSLPVLASLDAVTDFGPILEKEICAGVYVEAGYVDRFKSRLLFLAKNPLIRKEMGDNGRLFYESELGVEDARSKISSII